MTVPLHADAPLDVGYRDPSANLTGDCVGGGGGGVVVVKDSSGGAVVRPSARRPGGGAGIRPRVRRGRPAPADPGDRRRPSFRRVDRVASRRAVLVGARPARTGPTGRRDVLLSPQCSGPPRGCKGHPCPKAWTARTLSVKTALPMIPLPNNRPTLYIILARIPLSSILLFTLPISTSLLWNIPAASAAFTPVFSNTSTK